MTREPDPRPAASMEAVLRPAEARDVPRLAELSGQLGYPGSEKEFAARLESIRQSGATGVLVAEIDGDVVGWIQVSELEPSLVSGRSAQIVGLVVDELFRRAGVGRRLIAGAEAWARSRGHATLSVRSNAAREGAHDFYPRLGFELKKTQRSYAKKLGEPRDG